MTTLNQYILQNCNNCSLYLNKTNIDQFHIPYKIHYTKAQINSTCLIYKLILNKTLDN